MRTFSSILLLIFLGCAGPVYAVGFQRISVPLADGKTMEVAVWYPSTSPAGLIAMGPVSQTVAPGGSVDGSALPLVVVSHGTGGSSLSHYDTAIALAQAGFVVAAVAHPGDNYADSSQATAIMNRPKHMSALIDFMLQAWPAHGRIDPARIGIFGFSAGGFTALVDIGGTPDPATVLPFCAEHPTHFACMLIAEKNTAGAPLPVGPSGSLHDRRIRAAVIAAPALGFAFEGNGLKEVTVPVQLWRAEQDDILPHPWYAEVVRKTLRPAPQYHLVPKAGHFDFLAPCSKEFTAMAPAICSSAEGFDRTAFHLTFNAELVKFFTSTLKN